MKTDLINVEDDYKVVYDKCVSCDCVTDIPRDRHIDFRPYYVEGVGQLCNECGDRLFEK